MWSVHLCLILFNLQLRMRLLIETKKKQNLLKKGRDPPECSSFRPISLITSNLTIYAKALSLRLEKVIHVLVNEDQIGFNKGHFASDNM